MKRNRIAKPRTWAVECLEPRWCMASWFQYLTDTDVKPSAVAQFTDPDSIAVLGSSRRVDGESQYEDGVAVEMSPSGRAARKDLLPIDRPRPFPSETSTTIRDAKFRADGQLIIVGSSASDRSQVETLPASRNDGEGTMWRGDFRTGFNVNGVGFPTGGDVREGYLRACSPNNSAVSVGQSGVWASFTMADNVPQYVVMNGKPVAGIATATNGSRISVTSFDDGEAFILFLMPTGDLTDGIRLERPDDVFSSFVSAMTSDGHLSGFGDVYDVSSGTAHTVTLIWNPDGSLSKRIEFAGQLVESRVMVDGVVFFHVSTPLGETRGNEGSYVYLTDSDTTMPLAEWVKSLGVNVPGLTLSGKQRVVDAEWSYNHEWLNVLIDSDEIGKDLLIHLDESEVRLAARPWTNPDNYLNVNDDEGSLVTPIDALLILSKLNQQADSGLPYPRPVDQSDPFYYDTSKDGFLTPLDALLVINELNSPSATLAIGDYDIPPVELPFGFIPWTSALSPTGSHVVAGTNGQAAYVEITRDVAGTVHVSPVQTLTSLDAFAGGDRNVGIVRDVYINATGELEFVGSSSSPNPQVDTSAREGTVWNSSGIPIATGILPGADESQMFKGSKNGLYAGGSRNDPTLFSTLRDPINLTQSEFGIAVAISEDGSVIAGSVEGRMAYWTANVIGVDYTEHAVAIPPGGFDNGGIFAISDNWIAGVYFSDPLVDFAGAIWDTRNGSLIRNFSAEGPLFNVLAATIGGSSLIVGNRTVGRSPYLYVEDNPGTNDVNGLLPNLPWGQVVQVVAISSSSNGLALTAQTSSGIYIFASLKTSPKPRL